MVCSINAHTQGMLTCCCSVSVWKAVTQVPRDRLGTAHISGHCQRQCHWPQVAPVFHCPLHYGPCLLRPIQRHVRNRRVEVANKFVCHITFSNDDFQCHQVQTPSGTLERREGCSLHPTGAFKWPSASTPQLVVSDTSHSRSGTAESGFRRVPLAESKHKRQPFRGQVLLLCLRVCSDE